MQAVNIENKGLVKMGKELFEVMTEEEDYGEDFKQEEMAKGTCKICLTRESEKKKDWMVSPCLCSGSCASVHLSCLKRWVQYKSIVHEGSTTLSYKVDSLTCEICQACLPHSITYKGQTERLRPQVHDGECGHPHVTLRNEQTGVYHSICMEGDGPVSIGRSTTNHLLMDEMSISRKHASLSTHQGRVMISDNGSKFGTFVLLDYLRDCESVKLMSGKWTFGFSIE